MKCLRYLDLSETRLRCLPETIDELSDLQTLKLRGCSNLTMLPKGMRKLLNLRHLDFDVLRQLRSMPPEIGTLSNLQTLSAFVVGSDEECGIEQLKNMNKLAGEFCIGGLENVLTEVEAKEACLYLKSHIVKLVLRWSDSRDEDGSDADDEKVISSLRPHVSLEELQIISYAGAQLPNWICDPAYSKLVSITLFKCENCLAFPSLGQLPSLKSLSVVTFPKLIAIDHSFRRAFCIHGSVAFPKLEKLSIENMCSLEEWKGIEKADFPCLFKLIVKHCPKLHCILSLSCLFALEKVELIQCQSCFSSK